MYAVQSFDSQVAIHFSLYGAVLISVSRLLRAQFQLPSVNMFVKQLKQLDDLFWPHRRAHWDQEGVNDDGTMG